jgi:hypothetical protein
MSVHRYPGLVALCEAHGWACSDDLVAAYEATCITDEEVQRDPEGCWDRIRGALEEMRG